MTANALLGIFVLPAAVFTLAYFPVVTHLARGLLSSYAKADVRKRLYAATIDALLITTSCLLYWNSKSVVFLVAGAAYLLLRDARGGQSVGKFIVGLVVISLETGRPSTLMGSVRRNLLLLLPGANVAAVFLEAVTIVRDPQGQRLGDRLAQTQVVEGLGAKDLLKSFQDWLSSLGGAVGRPFGTRERRPVEIDRFEGAVMRFVAGAVCALLLAALVPGHRLSASGSCGDLSRLALPNTTITSTQAVEAGTFTPPDSTSSEGVRALPAFCRVAATLKPTSDSDIKMEVWLPASGWNGKFQAVGNGAFNGAIAYPAMMRALTAGYATSSTDTGHTGGGASFGLGHPEKVIDFGWRAVHEMTETSKKIIAAYYAASPTFSYWTGCSAGGRQAMKAAQRFPADFDGVLAGAPALDWTGRAAQAVRVSKALERTEAARLSKTQRELLHRAVVDKCDALDGVKDGLIENPKRCTFDPGVLQCKETGEAACLTMAQVATVRLMYSSPMNPKTKREITGLEPGSELGWTDLGWTTSARTTGLDQFRFLVFGDPNWDLQAFRFDSDIMRAEELDNDTINALDPNLKPFIDRGGKLIQYHGWSDPQISPENSTQYYARVLDRLGGAGAVHGSYRLFMAPGMAHCGGGEGPNAFDMVAALEQWVEHGKAPDQIVASHSTDGIVDRTRPLCPYPQVAAYRGTGSTDEAANFVCRAQ